jgi:hypothetical protein
LKKELPKDYEERTATMLCEERTATMLCEERTALIICEENCWNSL